MFGNGLVGQSGRGPMQVALKAFSLAASMAAVLSMTGCGGGSKFGNGEPDIVVVSTAPQITSVTSASAKLGVATNFVVTGKNLTDASIADKENNCDPEPGTVKVLSDTSITFTCTPKWFTMSFAAVKQNATSGLTDESLAVAFDLAKPRVTFKTTAGDIVIELEPRNAPGTVLNFLVYADAGYYDGTIFHRVLNEVTTTQVVQGGGFTGVNGAGTDLDAQVGTLNDPIDMENTELSNTDGTIAMARGAGPNTATSQFFFNTADNHTAYDYKSPTDPGYAVFGRVVAGRENLTVIHSGAVRPANVGIYDHVPVAPVTITEATVTINP